MAREALTRYRHETLQYAARPGLPELREWIAAFMNEDGAHVFPDEIIVLDGAKQGIDLACRALLDEGDSIVVTAPTYFTAIPIFKSFGAEFIEIGQDAEGMEVEQLAAALRRLKREGRKSPKFIYNVPDFHNPSGVTMSRRRREELLEIAQSNNVLVLEDSPYRKVRFEGESEPSLKALDRSNIVVTLGTFSKLMAPGLRIGWATGRKDLLARMLQLKSNGGTCPLTQRIIVEFCTKGHLAAHTDRVQRTYRTHRDTMVSALRRELQEATMAVPQGGYYLWVRLPPAIDSDELAKRVAEEGVTVLAGSKCFAGTGGYPRHLGSPKNYMRLAYSHASPDEIEEGIRRIARVVASMEA
jgi:2-aminoadipate transaminase